MNPIYKKKTHPYLYLYSEGGGDKKRNTVNLITWTVEGNIIILIATYLWRGGLGLQLAASSSNWVSQPAYVNFLTGQTASQPGL